MKLLTIYAELFKYRLGKKALPEAECDHEEASIEDAIVGFIHVEAEDREKGGAIVTKLIKNLKWLAGKNGTKRIVLHSFAHLSESKADPAFVREVLDKARERLENAGYEVYETPFGFFLDLEVRAPGHPLARVFKSF